MQNLTVDDERIVNRLLKIFSNVAESYSYRIEDRTQAGNVCAELLKAKYGYTKEK